MERITIVEDEVFMREELASVLKKAGYQVYRVTEFCDVFREIEESAPNLVLLDINLPGSSGFEICRQLKEKNLCPVLILTSRTQMKDELHALKLGADEFLTKPCHKERLLARIQNLLKRFDGFRDMLEGDGFYLDENTYTLYKGQKSMVLPETEGKILAVLMKNKGNIVTKKMLFQAVWGTEEYVDENILQVNLTRLRKSLKMFNLNEYITTVRGQGYRLECERNEG